MRETKEDEIILYEEKDPEVLESLRRFKRFWLIFGLSILSMVFILSTLGFIIGYLEHTYSFSDEKGVRSFVCGVSYVIFALIAGYMILLREAIHTSPLKITNKGIYLPTPPLLWSKFLPYEKFILNF